MIQSMVIGDGKKIMAKAAFAVGGRVISSRGAPYVCVEWGLWKHVSGIDIFCVLKQTGSGESQHEIPIVYAEFPEFLGESFFEISKEKSLSGLVNKALVRNDIQTGYVQYDKSFIVRSNHPQWLLSILDEEVTDTHAKHSKLSLVFQDGVLLMEGGKIINAERVSTMVQVFSLYVQRIQEVL